MFGISDSMLVHQELEKTVIISADQTVLPKLNFQWKRFVRVGFIAAAQIDLNGRLLSSYDSLGLGFKRQLSLIVRS